MTKKVDEILMIRIEGVLVVSQHVAADLLGISLATLIRWGKEVNPPPRRADGWYPARELGFWGRKVQVAKSTSKSLTPAYDHGPPGWGPKVEAQSHGAPNLDGVFIETKDAADTRLKIAQANRLEMEMAEKAGSLILASDVLEAWQRILTRVKTRLLKIPTTIAPMVLGDPDLYSIQRKLKEGVNDALTEASVDWRETQGVDDDDDE